MQVLRCFACGTAVLPSFIYCSTCGRRLNKSDNKGWSRLGQFIRALLLLWVLGCIFQLALPVAVRITPPCGTKPGTIALISRTRGYVDSLQWIVNGQAFLQAGDCKTNPPELYVIPANQPALMAAAQRDPQTWSGWLVASSEKTIASVTQTSVQWGHVVIDQVKIGYQWVVTVTGVRSCFGYCR